MRSILPVLLCLALAWADDGLSEAEKTELDQLLERLGSEDWEVRERASMALSKALASGRPIARFLAERMKAPDMEVRDRVRRLLLDSDHWDASPELLAEVAEGFVKECGSREMVAWFIGTKAEPSASLTEANARTVSILMRSAEGGEAILGRFEGGSEIYRRNVCWFVATHRPPGAAAFLQKASEDKDDLVRAYAAYGWGKMAAPACQGALLVSSQDTNAVVRAAAAIALEQYPDEGTVPILIRLLEDEDPIVRFHASYSLARVTGRDGGYDAWYPEARRATLVEAWKEWWSENASTWHPPERR